MLPKPSAVPIPDILPPLRNCIAELTDAALRTSLHGMRRYNELVPDWLRDPAGERSRR